MNTDSGSVSGATMKGVTVLGATGSIGLSTLDVLKRHPEKFQIIALTANSQVEKLFALCLEYRPLFAVMSDEEAAARLHDKLKQTDLNIEVMAGAQALKTAATLPETDYVMAAIVGAAGLLPTLAAAEAGKRVMLANKEALVMSGQLFMDAVKRGGSELLPIDSEHNAIFQSMPVSGKQGVENILLTGSGGPFLNRDSGTLTAVTPEEAVAHPNWSMGQKISVDSATMMNKGLEVIEACWLFDVSDTRVQVVVHPQSTIHSMVSYCDGSVIAQLGNPDMRTPIAYALGWPHRLESGVAALNVFDVARLDFQPPDFEKFPCLALAYQAFRSGGYACVALNAANEIAVAAFLNKQIAFTEIAQLITFVLEHTSGGTPDNLDSVLIQDADSREQARLWIKNNKKRSDIL